MKKEIIISTKYKKKLKEELKDLQDVGRPNIIKLLQEARALGDLSENAEYHAAKKRQGEIEGRIKVILATLEVARVVDPKKENKDSIGMGSVVTLKEKNKSEKIVYEIVNTEEVDLLNGKISNISPLGKNLIGHKVGDFIEFNENTFEIVALD